MASRLRISWFLSIDAFSRARKAVLAAASDVRCEGPPNLLGDGYVLDPRYRVQLRCLLVVQSQGHRLRLLLETAVPPDDARRGPS